MSRSCKCRQEESRCIRLQERPSRLEAEADRAVDMIVPLHRLHAAAGLIGTGPIIDLAENRHVFGKARRAQFGRKQEREDPLDGERDQPQPKAEASCTSLWGVPSHGGRDPSARKPA